MLLKAMRYSAIALILSGSAVWSQSPIHFLSGEAFLSALEAEQGQIRRSQQDAETRQIKLDTLKKIQVILKNIPENQHSFEFDLKGGAFSAIMKHVFEGSAEKAVQLYANITIGHHPQKLFFLSGAGVSEIITDLKEIEGGDEFISDRIYKNEHAYNTRNKIQLKLYRLDGGTLVCVDQHVADYGLELQHQGLERRGKSYGPIDYDVTIDIYQQMTDRKFQFISFNIYEGQTRQSRYSTLNTLQTAGNVLSLGILNGGIRLLVEKNVRSVWERRKRAFQKLLTF